MVDLARPATMKIPKITNKILNAIYSTDGTLVEISKALHCSITTLYRSYFKNPEFRECIDLMRNIKSELVLDQLFKYVMDDSVDFRLKLDTIKLLLKYNPYYKSNNWIDVAITKNVADQDQALTNLDKTALFKQIFNLNK